MIEDTNLVAKTIGDQRIPSQDFSELAYIKRFIQKYQLEHSEKIMKWFRFIQTIEIKGWRNRYINQKITKILERKEIIFYALFCPSYKKGNGEFGFRTDGVGATTKAGIQNLIKIYHETIKLGFNCQKPLAIFFDLAVEQPEIVIPNHINDLYQNAENIKKLLPTETEFVLLSDLFSDLKKSIGHNGVIQDPLPIPNKVFKRVYARGKRFYQIFGWSDGKILCRSKIVSTVEAIVGEHLKEKFPNGIMVYTPTMLERAAIYSGFEGKTNPLPIIFPTKGP